MMYDIIEAENLRFRPSTRKWEGGVFKNPNSGEKKMRFRWPFSLDTCGRHVGQTEEKYSFWNKNAYVWGVA